MAVIKNKEHHTKKPSPEKRAVIEGTIATTARGIGFLLTDDDNDIRIEREHINTALNGDTVRVRLTGTMLDGQRLGIVESVLERKKTAFVGIVDVENGTTFLIPDDRRMYADITIPTPPKELVKDMKVYVQMRPWTDQQENPQGDVIEVIGMKGVHEVEMRSILLERGIETSFPAPVEEEAATIRNESLAHKEEEVLKRRDMRGVLTMTIDPEDAKDFDDAISFVDRGDATYEIGVHIADVSYYVRPGSALDKEARERAFSTYLVDRTIPMLPETLSNDLCSLNPNEDKFTFSAIFVLNKNADVLERWFGKTVIHSDKRFTYEEAQKNITTGTGPHTKELQILNQLAKKFATRHREGGAIDFAQDEVKFRLDETGRPIAVYRKERLDTHKLVEEFMLLANKEVAEYIKTMPKRTGHEHPVFIYRVHDTPDIEKLQDLSVFLHALGYDFNVNTRRVSGKMLNELFSHIADTPEEGLIKTAALRSMAKAAYSVKNIGHFGLGFGYYTHFTSPIRRYADLIVHRLLNDYIAGNPVQKDAFPIYQKIALQISQKEISVVEAERDSIKYKQVEFMAPRVGETFDAIVSGVSEWGLFVEVSETKAEGLIRLRDMKDDFYVLDQKRYRLVGQKKKKVFSLGDALRVKLMGADVDKRTLDFALI